MAANASSKTCQSCGMPMKKDPQGKLREMGFPGFLAGMMTRGIPRLKRWSAP